MRDTPHLYRSATGFSTLSQLCRMSGEPALVGGASLKAEEFLAIASVYR